MDEPRQIRSYHRAYTVEGALHNLGDIHLLGQALPYRALIWFPVCELLFLILSLIPPFSLLLGAIGWEFTFIVFPLLLTALFTVASVEGRRLHVTVQASARNMFRSKHLNGALQPVGAQGFVWKPRRIRVVRDSR